MRILRGLHLLDHPAHPLFLLNSLSHRRVDIRLKSLLKPYPDQLLSDGHHWLRSTSTFDFPLLCPLPQGLVSCTLYSDLNEDSSQHAQPRQPTCTSKPMNCQLLSRIQQRDVTFTSFYFSHLTGHL